MTAGTTVKITGGKHPFAGKEVKVLSVSRDSGECFATVTDGTKRKWALPEDFG